MENREQIKATGEQIRANSEDMKAANKQLKEQMEATGRQIKEQVEATERQMKATGKRIGELTNRFGGMVEYMVLPNLVTKFEKLGFTFTKANRTEIKDKEHHIFLEVDALLENGGKVMAVEIKTKPSIEDIHDHSERMEKQRQYADLHGDKRVYLGAMTGVVFSNSEKIYALKVVWTSVSRVW
ncbi:MAG: hypothetical protein LBD37_10850 [Treponema sp.]|jgi:hypothetical protein|nr:hypothetical protein [Treponema sp.]